ncbi:MAG: hypothetical protein B9S32_16050 [Verrucomicrobia bacterium Tous-C9LFEB]|nr:MAG: hypothetical protein B9S32_16050 [Verrucomicrobia bacterium Tous-C9LFEB]
MSITEILEELPKLKTEERDLILHYIVVMERGEEDIPTTPAMLAAIDEADASPAEKDLTAKEIRRRP